LPDTSNQQYYVLSSVGEGPYPDIVLLDLGRNEEGQVLALAVYTSPEGEVQQEHLERFARANEGLNGVISHITLDELLDIMNREAPSLVLIDGEEVPGSAFKARIQEEHEDLMRRRRGSGWRPSEPPESPSEATPQPGRVEPQPAVQSAQAQESHEMHLPSAGGSPQPRDQQEPSERRWWEFWR
jgi:hypothetical protein